MPSSSSSSSSSPSCAPELTIINRVASIPIIAWSIDTVSCTLANNRYTSSSYSTAKNLSASAYSYTEPLQVRIAPLITTTDRYANKACDAVQSRYPAAFETKPEDVTNYVHQRRQSAADYVAGQRANANKTLDATVVTPAITVATEMDKV
jgi:hypothetical protein